MSPSFQVRKLRASLILPQGQFPGADANTLVLENLRMSARLQGVANYTNTCDISIFGMRQVDMNAVTVLWGQNGKPQNINARAILRLEAFDNGTWLKVFDGQFQEAQPDYRSLPDVCLTAQASTGYGQQILPASPTSYSGGVDAASAAQRLAQQMGFAFENNGVTATVHSPYYAGTLMSQFKDLAEEARFDFYFAPSGTLCITPKNQPRQNKT